MGTLVYQVMNPSHFSTLGDRGLASHSKSEVLLKTSPPPTFFEQKDREEVHYKLGDLEDIGPALTAKKELNEQKNIFISDRNFQKIAMERLVSLQDKLRLGFMAESNNIEDLSTTQRNIIEAKELLKIEPQHIEKWDVEVVFYFLIEENFSLDEINQITLSNLGIDGERWKNIVFEAKTLQFRQKILNFKNVTSISKDEQLKSAFIAGLEEQLIKNSHAHTEMAQSGIVPPSQRSKMDKIDYTKEQLEEMYDIPATEETHF